MTPAKALIFVERLLCAMSLLVIHGLLPDGERDKLRKRIDKWATQNGLRQKR